MGCGYSARNHTETNTASLAIGELLYTASAKYDTDHNLEDAIDTCHKARKLIQNISPNDRPTYSIMISSREGGFYYRAKKYSNAVDAFVSVISLSETMIAERSKGVYVVLQRYMECMCDLARIWKVQADTEGRDPKQIVNNNNNNININNNTSNNMKAYTKCETTLLRCIEAIEEGHNRRSDLLIEPLSLLSELYETLGFHSRAELFTRRIQGILIVQYGYNHPGITSLQATLDRLLHNKGTHMEDLAAVKIQSIFRMRAAMRLVGGLLGKVMKIHRLMPVSVISDNNNNYCKFLDVYCRKQVPVGAETGYSEGGPLGNNNNNNVINNNNGVCETGVGNANPLAGSPRLYEGLHRISI